MSDKKNSFYKIALQSSLFKGQKDIFFCFLKTEKIAAVLAVLAEQVGESKLFSELLELSMKAPRTLLRVEVGQATPSSFLAELLSAIVLIRMLAVKKELSKESALILTDEYERVVEVFASAVPQVSVLSSDDFFVQTFDSEEQSPLLSTVKNILSTRQGIIKDIDKGHKKTVHTALSTSVQQNDRTSLILEVVRKNQGVSIRGISAVVRDCSEKTIQRELLTLIEQGLVKKVGERRWSLYFAASAVPL